MGLTDRADAEEQAEMLARMATRVRQDAGLELTPDHTTKLPTVWIFRIVQLIMGVIVTVGLVFLNFKFLPREEAQKLFVSREVFLQLAENTGKTSGAVIAINDSILAMRGTLAELAAKGEKDRLQDERILRIEQKLDRERDRP